jgi:hypothetical protein
MRSESAGLTPGIFVFIYRLCRAAVRSSAGTPVLSHLREDFATEVTFSDL